MIITDCYSAFMEQTTPFGAALRYYRKKKITLTQKKFAKEIGISQAMLSKIERGLEDGSSKTREFITNYFKVPYDEFLETGRKELRYLIPEGIDSKIDKEIAKKIDALISWQNRHETSETAKAEPNNNIIDYNNPIKLKHHKIINQFPEPKEALEMNELAVEYVKKDPNAIKELIKYIKYQMSQIPEKDQKNGTG